MHTINGGQAEVAAITAAGHAAVGDVEAVPAPRILEPVTLSIAAWEVRHLRVMLREQLAGDTDLLEDATHGRTCTDTVDEITGRISLAVRLLSQT